jgi:hypothetical protein
VNSIINAYDSAGTGLYDNPVASNKTAIKGKVHSKSHLRPFLSTKGYAGNENRKLVTANPQLYQSGLKDVGLSVVLLNKLDE